jgi:hypothetical protein
MQLSLLPKLVEKLVWVPVISFCTLFIPSYAFDALSFCTLFIPSYAFDALSFCTLFIPSYAFDALLCRTLPFSPPNHVTLRITQFAFTNLRLLIKLFYNSGLLVMKANWKHKYRI